jgi:hypothetical protein
VGQPQPHDVADAYGELWGYSRPERYLNGPAADQVLAVEQVGGENSGVNWLLADAQGTVRDVVREAFDAGDSGGSVTSVVDHLFFDAYGNHTTAQTATDSQLQSRIGFEGMMTDLIAGFPATDSAGGLYYSAAQGWYDAVVGTFVTAAVQGYNSDVTNPFEFSGNNPTATDLSMASHDPGLTAKSRRPEEVFPVTELLPMDVILFEAKKEYENNEQVRVRGGVVERGNVRSNCCFKC